MPHTHMADTSSQALHAQRVDGVFQELSRNNINFGKFVLGTLRSKSSEIRSVITKWMRLSNSIEAQLMDDGSSGRKYGPENLLNTLVEEVRSRGDSAGIKRMNKAILQLAAPVLEEEMRCFCEEDAAFLRVPSTDVETSARLPESLPRMMDLYRSKLPALFSLFAGLIDQDAATPTNDEAEAPQVDTAQGEPHSLGKAERMLIGVYLAVTDAPDTVKALLHHCGLSVSQPTIRSALESISDAALPSARRLMEDKSLIKVFLFDNINIYMRRRQTRLTDYNTAAALTMRTMYTLPSFCSPADLTRKHVEQLQNGNRAHVSVEDVMPDDTFLERSAVISIATHLLPLVHSTKRQCTAMRKALAAMKERHAEDVIEPEASTFVSLKLLREDEGKLEGLQSVLTETVQELGMVGEGQEMEPLLVAGDLLTVRNTLAVQDAGTYEKANTVHKLDFIWPISGPWHLEQSWVYLIFATPLFNEAWDFAQQVWTGRLRAMLQTQLDRQTSAGKKWAPSSKNFFRMCRRLYRRYFTAQAVEQAREVAATKHGDIGRMRSAEKFMGMAFIGGGHHNYAHLIFDRILADKELPAATSRLLRVAQLVNRTGKAGLFEGADHYQETLNKEIQKADMSRSSHHILDRLEDRLSAIADNARRVKNAVSEAWDIPTYDRVRKGKDAELDIAQISRLTLDPHLFDLVPERRIGEAAAVTAPHGKGQGTSKAEARKDAEAGSPPYRAVDVLSRGYVKVRKGALARWQSRSTGMEIRQLLLETLAADDADDFAALTSGADTVQAEQAGSRVSTEFRTQRWQTRVEELWEEEMVEEDDE
ncbi:hypothetical protein OC842_002835 [Tilletia horrida]|uniref:DUF6589 domain-containing protein n=1 Tax=Tilletia horrida TaxID=155126 RepID=A0AAN6GCX8_9BASI|nr:hypothetical protein OC842_002835 [Tilletia horrida]